jgi:hypothetical protein
MTMMIRNLKLIFSCSLIVSKSEARL